MPTPDQSGLTSTLPPPILQRLVGVMKRLDDAGLNLALAESCTGGLVSSAFSGVEGLSHVFVCGFVTYSEDAKREALGVPQSVLERDGAVSSACAAAMAEGALSRSTGDLAVAITGFAGPAGPEDEEGLVWFGVAREGQPTRTRQVHFGAIGRDAVRLSCLTCVLDLLETELERRGEVPDPNLPPAGSGQGKAR